MSVPSVILISFVPFRRNFFKKYYYRVGELCSRTLALAQHLDIEFSMVSSSFLNDLTIWNVLTMLF